MLKHRGLLPRECRKDYRPSPFVLKVLKKRARKLIRLTEKEHIEEYYE